MARSEIRPDTMPDNTFFPPSTGRSLPIALLRARETVMAQFRPILARHNVTEQQWRVLRVLGEVGRLDASDLAFRASLLAPSLTRILRTLDERGLVKRQRDEKDARRSWIEIAAEGERLIARVAPEASAVYKRIEIRFGNERIAQLLDELEQLSDMMRQGDG